MSRLHVHGIVSFLIASFLVSACYDNMSDRATGPGGVIRLDGLLSGKMDYAGEQVWYEPIRIDDWYIDSTNGTRLWMDFEQLDGDLSITRYLLTPSVTGFDANADGFWSQEFGSLEGAEFNLSHFGMLLGEGSSGDDLLETQGEVVGEIDGEQADNRGFLADLVEGGVKGDFVECDSWACTLGQIGSSIFVVGDVRDFTAASVALKSGKPGAGWQMSIAVFAFLPIVGDGVKFLYKIKIVKWLSKMDVFSVEGAFQLLLKRTGLTGIYNVLTGLKPATLTKHVMHRIPGRLRLRMPDLRQQADQAQEVAEEIMRKFPGVTTDVRPTTGSIVFNYERNVDRSEEIIAFLTEKGLFDPDIALTSREYLGLMSMDLVEAGCKGGDCMSTAGNVWDGLMDYADDILDLIF